MKSVVVARGLVALLVGGLLVPLAASPANAACGPDFEFIGARGSGQPSRDAEFGMGREVSETFKQVETAVVESGFTIEPYGVQYPAVPVGGDFMGGLHGTTKVLGLGAVYNSSVDDGAADVVEEIRRQHGECSTTRFILSGYSQGAEAVAEAVGLLTPEERSFVAGSIYFGDPLFNASDERAALGNFEPNHHGMFTPRMPWEYLISSPVLSYCHHADPICGITTRTEWPWGGDLYVRDLPHIHGYAQEHNSGDLFAEHTNYVDSGDTSRAARRLVSALGIDSGAVSDEPIDIVFLVSGAATMESELPALKDAASELLGVVAAGSTSYRVAVMEQDGRNAYTRAGFTTDVTAFANGFQAIEADSSEAFTDMAYATQSALGVTWRPGARRAVVLINNVYGYEPDYQRRRNALLAVDEVATAVAAAVYPVSLTSWNQHVMSFMDDIASGTGGFSKQFAPGGAAVPGIKEAVGRVVTRPVAVLTGPRLAVTGQSVSFSAAGTRIIDPTELAEKYEWDSTAGDNAGWVPDDGPINQIVGTKPQDAPPGDESEIPEDDGESHSQSETLVPFESVIFHEPGIYPVSVNVRTSEERWVKATTNVMVIAGALHAPSEPQGLSATEGDGSVTFSWTPGDDTAEYYVIRDGQGQVVDAFVPIQPSSRTLIPSTELSYTLRGLENGTPLEFTLTAGNTVGVSEVSNAVVATPSAPELPEVNSFALHSNSSLSVTNKFEVTGPGGNVFVNGDFTCTVDVNLSGDVVVMGDAYLTNKCQVAGNLVVNGDVTMDSTPTVGGAVVAGGTVKFQSSARIGEDVRSGGSFISTDGKSTEWLTENDVVGGQIVANAAVEPATQVSHRSVEYDSADWQGVDSLTWRQWMNATATANNAPSWSQGLTSAPGCVMAPWGSSVNGDTVAIVSDTMVDARQGDSGCASVALQGMTLQLSADLVLFADSAKIVNGLTVHSAYGEPHVLRILVPGGSDTCATGHGIAVSGGTTIDPNIATQLVTPGKVILQGKSSFTGQLSAGCIDSSGQVTIDYSATAFSPG